MANGELVLGMTGASGATYGVRLLEVLLRAGRTIHLVISPSAAIVLQEELGRVVTADFNLADLLGDAAPSAENAFPGRVHYHLHGQFHAGIASGSFLTAAW